MRATEFDFHQLTPISTHAKSGSFGSVVLFQNEKGTKIAAKTMLAQNSLDNGEDELTKEFKAHEKIVNTVGPHRNLVAVHGIAAVPVAGEMKRALLMDAVPGATGDKAFEALYQCWESRKISHAEYWGAIQFLASRLLDVVDHIGKAGDAGVFHNDIQPENFIVNEKTGEPVLIDFGQWSDENRKSSGGMANFAPPEKFNGSGFNERSDVFSIGATLVDGTEKGLRPETLDYSGTPVKLAPNKGLHRGEVVVEDDDGNIRRGHTHLVETGYTQFISNLLAANKNERVTAAEAKKLDFLELRMLSDDPAKEVIKKALNITGGNRNETNPDIGDISSSNVPESSLGKKDAEPIAVALAAASKEANADKARARFNELHARRGDK